MVSRRRAKKTANVPRDERDQSVRRIGVRLAGENAPADRGHVTNIRLEMTIDGERAIVEWKNAQELRTAFVESMSIGSFFTALAFLYVRDTVGTRRE